MIIIDEKSLNRDHFPYIQNKIEWKKFQNTKWRKQKKKKYNKICQNHFNFELRQICHQCEILTSKNKNTKWDRKNKKKEQNA